MEVTPLGADSDGDGLQDLVVLGSGVSQPYLAITSMADLPTPIQEITLAPGQHHLADCQADLSGDGFPDVVTFLTSELEVRSGIDLHTVQTIPGITGGALGPRVDVVAAVSDTNSDGQSDILMGTVIAGLNRRVAQGHCWPQAPTDPDVRD
ncbi:MAG: hypothetical protein GY930_00550 [bacterium]|nr:hypothetical protein [bacterium]